MITRFLIGLVVIAVALGALGPRAKDAYDQNLYIAKTDGYAQAKAKYAPAADPRVTTFARAFCEGDLKTMEPYSVTVAMLYGAPSAEAFLASAGFTQQSCPEGTVQFLGSFVNSVGETVALYILTMPTTTNWFAFTFDTEMQVVSVK